ncbi:unnamed protein product, partial [Didymodactylos carnosus]
YTPISNETTPSHSFKNKKSNNSKFHQFCKIFRHQTLTSTDDNHPDNYRQKHKRSNYFKSLICFPKSSFTFRRTSQSSITGTEQELTQNGEQIPGNIQNQNIRLSRRDSDTQHQQHRREMTQEARVTRSLAVVIGCFICCWLPFFTLYITRAACNCLSFEAIEFFVWLGYSNSCLNPVLYAILNKNFRLAFKNIIMSVKKLCCLFKFSH